MSKPVIDVVDTKYIRQIQQQQIELALVKAQLDAAVRARDEAQARSAAMTTLVDALRGSLRPYGLSRRRFLSAIRDAARAIPDQGPDAHQHVVLFEGSNRILNATATRLRPPMSD